MRGHRPFLPDFPRQLYTLKLKDVANSRKTADSRFFWKFYVCSAMLFVGWKTAKRIGKRGFGDING
jgi:hypothetical protein